MNISELKIGASKVDVEGTVKKISDTRAFSKFGKELKVANAILEDDSGAVKLTLWNDEIMKVKEGDKVKISNGYVNEFNGEKQLTAGKFGEIEVIES
jgi:replication factor A1